MKLERVTADADIEEPVDLAEVKARSRITASSEDALLGMFIAEATQAAEAATWSRFCTQTHKAYYDNFAQLSRGLPYPPLSSVIPVGINAD